ncbi:MAG: 3-oxoacyl-ACP reductase FabG [Deltaproteobacteria bacterium]|nr:3-oxoacyl-ACP reductase FabG [Deltaproteobacteria bacterium]MBW2049279.1 3-oxoacyl-ACP reductase FabG [Deltaproteobacteria bacterium]
MNIGDKFKGRVALVTGAAQGIGRAIALKMGREGASLALMDINEKIFELANQLESGGMPSSAFKVDVGEERDVEDAVAQVMDRFKRLDIVVNNAGLVRPAPFEKVTDDDWDAVININLKGAFFCVRQALPHMKEQHYGKIVNIGSRAGLGKMDRTVYSTTKAGMIGLTRTLALELAPHNINVNNVAPGPIATELFTAANPPGSPKTEAILKSVPLGRVGQPEDVANAVAFLASDEAGFITGQTLFVCGGLTIGGVYF